MNELISRNIWQPIPSLPNYEVSTGGLVRRLERKDTAAIVKSYIDNKYNTQAVTIKDNGHTYDVEIPILMAFTFFDVPSATPGTVVKIAIDDRVSLVNGSTLSVNDMTVFTKKPTDKAFTHAPVRKLTKRGVTEGVPTSRIIKAITAEEFWASIPGFNFYKVSSQGRVRSERGAKDSTRYLTPTVGNVKGTAVKRFTVRDHHGKSVTFLAHDLVARSFFNINQMFGKYMEHTIEATDGDLTNVRLDNLVVKHLTGGSGLEDAPLIKLESIFDSNDVAAAGQLSALLNRTSDKIEDIDAKNAFLNIVRGSFVSDAMSIDAGVLAKKLGVKEAPVVEENTQERDYKDAMKEVSNLIDSEKPISQEKTEQKETKMSKQYFETPEEAMNAPFVEDYPPAVVFEPARTKEYWRRFRDAEFVVSSFGNWKIIAGDRLIDTTRDRMTVRYTDAGVTVSNDFSIRRAVALCFVPGIFGMGGASYIIDKKKPPTMDNLFWRAATRTRHPVGQPEPTEAPVASPAPTPAPKHTPAPASAPKRVFSRPEGFPAWLAFSPEEAIASGPDTGPLPVDEETGKLIASADYEIWRRLGSTNLVMSTQGRFIHAPCFSVDDEQGAGASSFQARFIYVGLTALDVGHRLNVDPATTLYKLFIGDVGTGIVTTKRKGNFSLKNISRTMPVNVLETRLSAKADKILELDNPNIRMGVVYSTVGDLALAAGLRVRSTETYPPSVKLHGKTEVWRQYLDSDIAVSSHGKLMRLNPYKGASYVALSYRNADSTIELRATSLSGAVIRKKVEDIIAMCFAVLPEGLTIDHAIAESSYKTMPTADSVSWIENPHNRMPAAEKIQPESITSTSVNVTIDELNNEKETINAEDIKLEEKPVAPLNPNSYKQLLSKAVNTGPTFYSNVNRLLADMREDDREEVDNTYPPTRHFPFKVSHEFLNDKVWRRYGKSNLLVANDGTFAAINISDNKLREDTGFCILPVEPGDVVHAKQFDDEGNAISDGAQGVAFTREYAGDVYVACFTTLAELADSKIGTIYIQHGKSIRTILDMMESEVDSADNFYSLISWTMLIQKSWYATQAKDGESYIELERKGELQVKIIKPQLSFKASNSELGISIDSTNLDKVAAMVGVSASTIAERLAVGEALTVNGWTFTPSNG